MASREMIILHLMVLKFDFITFDLYPERIFQVGDVAGLQTLENLFLLLLALELFLKVALVLEVDPELNLDENFLIDFDFVQDSQSTDMLGTLSPTFTDQFVDKIVPKAVDLFSFWVFNLVQEMPTLGIFGVFPFWGDAFSEEHEAIDRGFDQLLA